MAFPIYVNDGGLLPERGEYYVISSSGIYLHKDTGFASALVKVEGISFLEPLTKKATLRLPVLPLPILARSLMFFRAVYRRHKTESIVLLNYSPETEEYYLSCPEQEVSAAMVEKYDRTLRIPDMQLVGTIHSHADFGAFHSSIDKHDESDFDGVHITIGHVNHPAFTLSAQVAINGNRFNLDLQELCEGLRPIAPLKRGWLDKLLDEPELPAMAYAPVTTIKTVAPTQYWELDFPEGTDFRNIGLPLTWLDKVKKVLPKYLATDYTRPTIPLSNLDFLDPVYAGGEQ
jgi:proteasome lid subunit RPN8/RPN11